MNKKTIIAGVMSIMMLSAVPAFAATSHHHDNTPAHHISTEAQHFDHDKKDVKPPKHKEVKPLPPKHNEHNQIDNTTRGRG